jgi:hypothetical protein
MSDLQEKIAKVLFIEDGQNGGLWKEVLSSTEHRGDCTNEPFTCMKCLKEEYLNKAIKVILTIFSSTDRYSEGYAQKYVDMMESGLDEIIRKAEAYEKLPSLEGLAKVGECDDCIRGQIIPHDIYSGKILGESFECPNCHGTGEIVTPLQFEDVDTMFQICKRLAEWSTKWPRERVYSMNIQKEMDGELIGIEDAAIEITKTGEVIRRNHE